MTVKEFAERAEIHPKFAYALIAAGKVPHHRIGGPGRRGAIRITEQDFSAFLAATQIQAKAYDKGAVHGMGTQSSGKARKAVVNKGTDRKPKRFRDSLLGR